MHKHEVSKETAQALYSDRIKAYSEVFKLITDYKNALYREGMDDFEYFDEKDKPVFIEQTKKKIYSEYVPKIIQFIEKNYFLFSNHIIPFYEEISDSYNKIKVSRESYIDNVANDIDEKMEAYDISEEQFLKETESNLNVILDYIKNDIEKMKDVYL